MTPSRHAAERWTRRIGPAPCAAVAVRAEALRAVQVPRRAVRELHLDARPGRRVLVGARATMVVRGDVVVTLVRTTEDCLAGALVWLLCGCWP